MNHESTKKCNDLRIHSSLHIDKTFGNRVRETKVRVLIDSYSKEELERKYKILSKAWFSRKNSEQFLSYMESFQKVSKEVCMLATTRTSCGLGDSPEDYTQRNELINLIIGKISLNDTIKLLQHEIQCQEEEVNLALVGKGTRTYIVMYFTI